VGKGKRADIYLEVRKRRRHENKTYVMNMLKKTVPF
jgi:hypothetical protein